MRTLLRFSFSALLLLGLSMVAMAQSQTEGAIGGTVKDPQGAVIPNASVTVRNEGTNRESTATTDREGRFRIPQLQPGNYTLTIAASGFTEFSQPGIVVEVGLVTPLDISLGVGGAAETVTVTSEAPVINTEQQDFSSNINQISINNLPTNGNRWSNLVILTPGTSPDGDFGLVSFRGISGLLNNNTVDGGDNNQAFFSEERGRTRIPYAISQSTVREFQVNTSNYSAEFGRSAGGVVNAVTQSGTNEFHGSLFYRIRDNRWGARNPNSFDLAGNALKPEDRRQQFGGSIGGPIARDRLFFFFTYDQSRRNFPGLGLPQSQNFFNARPNFNRTLLRARGLTDAQIDSAVGFLQGLTGVVPRRQDQYIVFPKIDWNINQNHSFTISYNHLRAESPAGVQTPAIVSRGIASFGDDNVSLDFVNVRLNSVLSPNLLNVVRFQWGRDFETQISQPPGPGEPTTGPGGFPPSISVEGGGGQEGFTIGKPNFLDRAAYPDERRIQIADTVTLTRGRHTLRFGFDFNRVHDTLDNLFQGGGVYTYNNLNDFIIDHANWRSPIPNVVCTASTRRAGRCYTSNFAQAFGPSRFEFATYDYNFFIQDDFRVTPHLTLNLGLRYEYQQLPEPQIPNPLSPATGQFPSDKNNFGPRVGFAYDLTGDGRTSVRGGYGIYFGRIVNSTISNAITNTAAPGSQFSVSVSPASSASPIFPNVLPSAAAGGTPNIVQFSPFMQNPTIHQGDFIIEREIARNTVVSASYLLSIGRNLPTFVDINLPFPTASRTWTIVGGDLNGQRVAIPQFGSARINPNFNSITEIRSTIRSEYHALVLQANRRLTNGFQLQSSYTLSRARDNGQSSQTFTTTNVPANPYDLLSEWGYSRFDRRHKFAASAVWSPDFFADVADASAVGRALFNGWTIAPTVTVFSGLPVTAEASTNLTGSSGGGGRIPFLTRNSFRAPGQWTADLRVSRRFRLGETTNLELMAEAFNVFNHVNVTFVNSTLYTANTANLTLTTSDQFLQPGRTGLNNSFFFRERQVQLAARFNF